MYSYNYAHTYPTRPRIARARFGKTIHLAHSRNPDFLGRARVDPEHGAPVWPGLDLEPLGHVRPCAGAEVPRPQALV